MQLHCSGAWAYSLSLASHGRGQHQETGLRVTSLNEPSAGLPQAPAG